MVRDTYLGLRTTFTWSIIHLWTVLQLLKEKNLIPELKHNADDIVLALEDNLRVPAAQVAARLRNAGRVVELVLESKRLKWWVVVPRLMHVLSIYLLTWGYINVFIHLLCWWVVVTNLTVVCTPVSAESSDMISSSFSLPCTTMLMAWSHVIVY